MRDVRQTFASIMQLFFSLHGRVSRLLYWMMDIIMGVLAVWLEEGHSVVPAVLVLVFLWPKIAISVKRWHDRNKSGWWVFINLVPIVGPIWALIEQGFLQGTEGPNDYGDDPLAGQRALVEQDARPTSR